MKLTLPRAALRAAALFVAPKSDARAYIQGVALEVASDEVRIMATNGSAMMVYRAVDCVEGVASTEEFNIIVPAHALSIPKGVVTQKMRHQRAFVQITNMENGSYELQDGIGANQGAKIDFLPIAGVPPNYRRIMPAESAISGKTAAFDPELLARFSKAAKEFDLKSTDVVLRHNGERAGLVALRGEENFIGLIMPLLRRETMTVEVPSWAKETHSDRLLRRFIDLNEKETITGQTDDAAFRVG